MEKLNNRNLPISGATGGIGIHLASLLVQSGARVVWLLCHQPVSGVVSDMVLQPFNHQAI